MGQCIRQECTASVSILRPPPTAALLLLLLLVNLPPLLLLSMLGPPLIFLHNVFKAAQTLVMLCPPARMHSSLSVLPAAED